MVLQGHQHARAQNIIKQVYNIFQDGVLTCLKRKDESCDDTYLDQDVLQDVC